MKKTHGITIGGLQQKTVTLVLILLILTIGLFAAVNAFERKMMSQIVSETREGQQNAIVRISGDSMHHSLEQMLVNITAVQADYANDDFSEIINDISILQGMAQFLLENRDRLPLLDVLPPDPAAEGTFTAQALYDDTYPGGQSEYLGAIAHLSNAMIALCRDSSKIRSCYMGLADGSVLFVDEHSASRFDQEGQLIPFPARERPWYKSALEAGGPSFAGIIKDAFSGEIGLTCSAPVYVDGEVLGVIAADIVPESINRFIHDFEDSSSYSFIVNDSGQVILAPARNGLFVLQTADKAQDLRSLGNIELAQFIDQALKESTGMTTVTLDREQYYMTGAPMPAVGWAAIMVVSKAVIEEPTTRMLQDLEGINRNASARFQEGNLKSYRVSILMFAAILVIGFFAAFLVAGRIARPIEKMTRSITNSSASGNPFEMQDAYRTHDEIQLLAEAFEDLSKKTRQYITDITRITKEKERIGTELELARKIQASMLPSRYPAFPDRHEFDIYATMDPAKEVGGDFYDYFLIDDDHLGLVMADVSGKGIPAALFMMMSKILINNFAMMGGSPAKVLERTNEKICQSNEDEMFVTVWLGVLELSTGRLTAANAGHEYPIIRRANGAFEVLKDRHGFVIGGMEGVKYQDYEITLEKGGTLFLYTDGVPEATNAAEELFGMQRLVDTLNQHPSDGPVELLASVKQAVNDFVGTADQFDDMTMLGITLRDDSGPAV